MTKEEYDKMYKQEEIKPILNRLKMFSKYKKYIYPIEMDISECKMLYDYINTLEKTIKKKDEGIKAFCEELCEYATKLEQIKECINHYAIENEDYSKIYNDEEIDLLKIIGDE